MTGPIEARAAEVHGARGGCVVCLLDSLRAPFQSWDELSLTARERHRIYARALLAEELLRELQWGEEGYCPVCAKGNPSHSADCRLGALLAEFDQVVHWWGTS